MGRAGRPSAAGSGRREYWGSAEQPYWRPGANPTVDLVIMHEDKVLLIQRGGEPYRGSWALAGGFHDTKAPRGEEWQPGLETASEAASRELQEETGVRLQPERLSEVCVFDRFGRDPRDNEEAWSVSRAFLARLDEMPEHAAGDDAADARWFSLSEIAELPLAFDHREMLQKALQQVSR